MAVEAQGGAALRRRLLFWLRVGVSALLLVVQARRSDLGELRVVLARVEPGWLLGAFLLLAASHVVGVVRWIVLARPLGFGESFGRFFSFYFSGMFLNLLAPGTVAGDIGRGLFLAGGRRRLAALATVVAQRAVGLVGLAWIGVAALSFDQQAVVSPSLVRLTTATAVAVTLGLWWGPRLAVRLLPREHAARRFVERDLRPFWHDRSQVAWSLATAFLYHLLQIGSMMLVAWSLGIALAARLYFAFVPLVSVAVMVPVSFSGIGVRESGFRYFLARAGVDPEAALAVGLIGSALAVVIGLLGAPAFLRGRDASLNNR